MALLCNIVLKFGLMDVIKITKFTEHVRYLPITQAIELDLGRSWTFIIQGVSQI